ncbi:MAG: GAF domain-containing protein [Methanobacteriota archaeon]|nr:MAG: GAF domain-containing protein [Euryarchaeota archaeon]
MLEARGPEEEAILAALMGITEMMGDLTDLEELLDAIVRIAPRLVSVDRCAIFLRNPRDREFRVAHAWSEDAEATGRLMRLAIPEADIGKLTHKLVDQRVPVMLRTGREDLLPLSVTDSFQIRSMLLVPLVYQDQVMGFITLDEASKDHLFTSREVNVVQAIAAHAAVAIVHTRLAEAYRIERRRGMALADAVCDGVIILDRQLRVAAMSPGAEALLGWLSDEVEGKAAADAFDDPGLEAAATKVLAGAMRDEAVAALRTKDGRQIACDVVAIAVPGAAGGPSEVLYALTRADREAKGITTRHLGRTGASSPRRS